MGIFAKIMAFIAAAIVQGTPLLFGATGEIITEKAGHLNLGIPGIMCVGTAGGCYAVSLYMRSASAPSNASWLLLVLLAVLMAVLFAAALGGISSAPAAFGIIFIRSLPEK